MQIAEQVKRKMNPLACGLITATSRICRLALAGRLLCLICPLAIAAAKSQDVPQPPLPVDPTPLIELLSATEKSQLEEARNHKREVEFYVRVGDSHLDMARSSIKNGDYRTSERELDIYNKAMTEAMKATLAQQDGRRGLAKKIEQQLYKQIKTLEGLEVLFPFERQQFASAALKLAKQLRVQALNAAFASGETLKDPEEQKKTGSPNKDGSAAVEKPFAAKVANLMMGWSSERHRARVSRVGYAFRADRLELAQARGDYLTDEEDIKVREAQTADARAKVFMRIADRRIQLITGNAPAPVEKQSGKKGEKKAQEEEREWGVLKTTSKTELLKQYSRAVEECMAKIEDAYERNPKSTALPKALTTLREATARHLQALKALAGQVADEDEKRALQDAIEEAELANKGASEGIKAK
ncbi:MAG TPA: hypothetical protein VNS63_16195 [Blastocatellia bacterium]|nr:hypothetical protein [Blastocatellia bacterium]